MRTLSSTLLAAQKSASRRPYVKVEAVNKIAGVVRLEWSRLYAGEEPDCHHAAAMPADGSLVRARVDSSSGYLYRQRIAGPCPESDFSAWTQVGQVSDVSGFALAASGATVLLFYVSPDEQTVCCRESADSGASFGDETTILTAGSSVGWLAAGISGAGIALLLYSVAGTVYAVKRNGGNWGAPAAWSNSLAEVSGLAVCYQGDWDVAVCGKDSSDYLKVWTCLYGDGYAQSAGTWSLLKELTAASPDSGVEFRAPSLAHPDVFRLFFVEAYGGTQSYSRPCWTHSLPGAAFGSNLWREPVPFDLDCAYGAALASHGSYAWLSNASGVWRAAISPVTADLTADVVRLTSVSLPASGRARVDLRNDDGRYHDFGAGGLAALKMGSELRISPGYVTVDGNEVSSGPAYWIEGWEHASRGGTASLSIEARDGWGLLAGWRARRQYAWAAGSKNVFQLLSFVLARAGLELSSLSASDLIQDLYPAFAIHPGESGARAVQRLLQMVPDVLFFRGSLCYAKDPLAGEAADYSYGAGHSTFSGRYRSSARAGNRVQVFGKDLMVEQFDWTEVSSTYDRLLQVHDLNLEAVADAEERLEAELRGRTLEALGGEIVAPVNCGQELYDVVEITDERAGLAATKRRVLGVTLEYSLGKEARYEQRLALGGV